MKNIYHFTDYKSYIKDKLIFENVTKTNFSKKLNVQVSFLSQVLNGEKNITLEQALNITEIFRLQEEEQDYFFKLVQKARVKNPELLDIFKKQLEEIQIRKGAYELSLKSDVLADKEFVQFTSRWYYSAIHALLRSKKFSTVDSLVKALKIKGRLVKEALNEFEKRGFVTKNSDSEYSIAHEKEFFTFQDGAATLTDFHHTWRLKALSKMEESNNNDLFSTNTFLLTEDAALKIREILLEVNTTAYSIAQANQGAENGLYVICSDFFKVDS